MTPSIYFLPGLGADFRLFRKQLEAGMPITILEWKIPLKGETIQQYAARMAADISKSDKLILGGVSMGGMMAIEIAKIVRPEKLILISSAKNRNELPLFFRFFKYLPVQRWLPYAFFNNIQVVANAIYPLFGKMRREEKKIFVEMAKAAPQEFVKWALNAIVTWENTEVPAPTIHIHGTADLILPYRYVRNVITIKKGTHLMISERAEEINAILNREFKQ